LGAGFTEFVGTSTGASGVFTNNGGTVSGAEGGNTVFSFDSTGSNGIFTNNGGAVSGAFGGYTRFEANATAGNATLTNNGPPVSGAGGGYTLFDGSSTAGSATLIANGGVGTGGRILFWNISTGGTALVKVFGNGNLDIGNHNSGVIIGSLEGTGNVFLGARGLFVGSNNLSTTFSGQIQDGGMAGGVGGSLSKTGTGVLMLLGANTYTGQTNVNAGTLFLSSSGTATGAMVVNGGVLGGSRMLSGPVVVNSGAALLAGNGTVASGTLIMASNVTFNSGSIIKLVLGTSGAHSTITRTNGTWTFAANQAFTFINNGAQPGVYDNIITGLAADPGTEGSWTITNPGFTGTFSYDGAGNIDLVLTAVHPQLTAAVSQKVHGSMTFGVALPLNGSLGIECRRGGATGDHQLVISFTNNVSVNGTPQAAVTSGQGLVGTGGVGNGGAVTVSGSNVTVPLTNVTNAQTIVVTLFSVNDGTNIGDVSVPLGVLLGDVNSSHRTDSGDVTAVRNHTVSPPTDDATARFDVNVSNRIDAGDVTATRNATVTVLP
jgi:autotransporter-associated beta strand protein